MIDPQEFKNLFQQNIQLHRHKGIDSPQIDYGDLLNIGSNGTNKTVIPIPAVPLTVNANPNVITEFNTASNTTAWLGRVNIPFTITANKITIAGSWLINSSEAAVLSLYSEDGQTRIFSVTTAAFPNGNANFSTALSAVLIPAGSYYICFIPTLGTGPASYFWEDDAGQGAAFLTSGIASKAVLAGTLAVTAATAPTTIDPTAITYSNHKILYFRLDN